MNISGINGDVSEASKTGAQGTTDTQSRAIQKQIEDARKRLQEVSADKNLSAEDKMKKRQEIQKEISDLNMQLRQHQAEVRRQEQEEKRASSEAARGKQKTAEEGNGFSTAGMQAVLSADASMKQAQVQESSAKKMEGRANVLESEIKQDKSRGGDTRAKEAELAEARQKAEAAEASGMDTLKEVNRRAGGASETPQDGRVKGTDTKTEAEQTDKESAGADDNEQKEPGMYVDVRL